MPKMLGFEKYIAMIVAFCLFVSTCVVLVEPLRVFAEVEEQPDIDIDEEESAPDAAADGLIRLINGTGSGDGAKNGASRDRKADSIAKVIELAVRMAKRDVGASYSAAEGEALAEAAEIEALRIEAAARAAAEKAAADAAERAAAQNPASSSSSTGGKKIVYITVDDGPSKLTDKFLDTFEKHGVRATFFVVGRQAASYPDQIKRMQRGGHCIANHSYTHDYATFYETKSSFSSELKKWDEAISKILGRDYHTNIFRFPGGSTYSRAKQYRDYVKQLGYVYYDWTCLNGDAEISNRTADNLYNYLVKTYNNRNEEVVLIHDTNAKQTTVDMLDRMIRFFKNNGYEFRTLAQK